MTTLREALNIRSLVDQVHENLENALENDSDDVLTRDPTEVAAEMFEYTTFEDDEGSIVTIEDGDDDGDLERFVHKIAGYVKVWQDDKRFS